MVSVTIKSSGDTKLQLDVELSQTVLDLKTKIAGELDDTPVDRQRLIYAGRILKDEDKLEVYKIADGNTIHMVKSGAKKAAPAAAGAIQDSPAVSAPQQAPPQPQQPAGGMPGMADMASMFSGIGGMGGMPNMGGMGGMPNMGGMGGMPQMSPEMLEQMYSNPMVQQMMEQVYSNPELMRSMIDSNPMLQQQLTPQMRAMLDNPEFLRMATNPEMMRAAAQFQSSMQQNSSQGGQGIYNPWASTPSSGAPQNPFASMINSGMIPQPPAQTEQASQEPPEQRFSTQLQQLNDMGFWNKDQNIRALIKTSGNVNGAIELLLASPEY
ncbi:hypothetical protein GGH96_005257 [Coemansia sp. RSA 1972]|nr:hypothetical protein GGH96_005257 [Coemansia sp. RSA 1972]